MNYKYKNVGISLIVLVITIIVIIILAGSVILTLAVNNPINSANEAVFKSDLDAIESDLSLYLANEYASVNSYNPENLNADDLTVQYNGKVIIDKTIKDIIPTLSVTDKYNGQFEVINGKLVYVGTDRVKKIWAQETNVEVIDADRLDAIISTTNTLPISAGTDVITIIKISSNSSINNINLTSNLELLDQNNILLPVQPVFVISAPSGNELDTLRTVNITIKTNTLAEGIYKLKLKANCISNIYDVKNSIDIISSELFEIDNTPPANPEMLATPSGWTNSNVLVSITYPLDSTVQEYSLDGNNWSQYTTSITVNTNNTTVYARSIDIAGNQSGQSTITIANIDIEVPLVTAVNNGTTTSSVNVKAVATDIGGSGVNTLSYQFSKDNGVTWTEAINSETYNFTGLTTGTYQCKVKVKDNVGNVSISNSLSISTKGIGTIGILPSTTEWTNQNVIVTITYPSELTAKQYSLDNGNTWNAYTGALTISSNITVIAKGTDIAGNQSAQASLTINNIVKEYTKTGLVLQYDGYTSPVGNIWNDLSGNGNNGIMSGFNGTAASGWNTNGINLDGIDDYIYTTNELANPIVTVQIVSELKSLETIDWPYDHFVSNYESGGYGFVVNNSTDGTPYIDVPQNKIGFSVFVDGYKAAYSNDNIALNKVYYLTGRYDGNTINLWVDGIKQLGSTSIVGVIGEPMGDQNFIVGGNPDGGIDNTTSPNMNTNEKIYAVRIYNRALTEDEINRNYQLDKLRFGL